MKNIVKITIVLGVIIVIALLAITQTTNDQIRYEYSGQPNLSEVPSSIIEENDEYLNISGYPLEIWRTNESGAIILFPGITIETTNALDYPFLKWQMHNYSFKKINQTSRLKVPMVTVENVSIPALDNYNNEKAGLKVRTENGIRTVEGYVIFIDKEGIQFNKNLFIPTKNVHDNDFASFCANKSIVLTQHLESGQYSIEVLKENVGASS